MVVLGDADPLQHNVLEKTEDCVGPKNITPEATMLTKAAVMEKANIKKQRVPL